MIKPTYVKFLSKSLNKYVYGKVMLTNGRTNILDEMMLAKKITLKVLDPKTRKYKLIKRKITDILYVIDSLHEISHKITWGY